MQVTSLKIAIDFEALFHVKKAFVKYAQEVHSSSIQYSDVIFGDPAVTHRWQEQLFEARLDEFFYYHTDKIRVAPGAMEIVMYLQELNGQDMVVISDYPDKYIPSIRKCIDTYFWTWKPAVFCNKMQFIHLIDDQSLQNIDIEGFLDDNPKFATEILDQGYVSKAQICACLDINAAIDTNPITAQDMGRMGIKVSMIERLWNLTKKPDHVHKAKNWNEVMVEMRILTQERK